MSNPDQLLQAAADAYALLSTSDFHIPDEKYRVVMNLATAIHEAAEAAAMAATVPADVLNVLRVALDRADMAYRATGFKPHDIEAAKHWVREAIAKG